MNRDDALAFACGSMCLQLHSIMPHAMQPVSITHGGITGKDLVTWLVKGTRFLTLIKTERATVVYDHADDFLYYANPDTELHKDCPAGHAFLAQIVQDRQSDGSTIPRLLIMDLVCPRIDCPRQRGEVLRGVAHLLSHVCHVQWSGDKAALEQFVGSGSVPHDVEALVALRGPLCLSREPATRIAALDSLAELHRRQ
jgi:hypothetical protein